MSDIVNAIDALIEEQLSQGEPERGFDAGDPDFPTCPHCDRDWHGFPLTKRVAVMYSRGSFDEGYSVKDDESPVLCPGSNFIGPVTADAVALRTSTSCLDLLAALLREMDDDIPPGSYLVLDLYRDDLAATLTVVETPDP